MMNTTMYDVGMYQSSKEQKTGVNISGETCLFLSILCDDFTDSDVNGGSYM